jgi:hypothetical protein
MTKKATAKTVPAPERNMAIQPYRRVVILGDRTSREPTSLPGPHLPDRP